MNRLLAILAIVVVGGSATLSPLTRSAPPKLAPEIEEILWWLPADTETLQVTQTPARARGPLFEAMPTAAGKIDFEDRSFGKTLNQALRATPLKATVDGSRRFVAPKGLGEMPSEGARIFLFAKPLGATANGLMAQLEKGALSTEQIGGVKVVVYREKVEDDIETLYVTIPQPDVLLMASNREYVEEVLRRRGTRAGARALPQDLPEWSWTDTTAPYWAVRHYRRDNFESDPTSPFRKDAEANVFDADAVGVAAHAAADGAAVVVHYLSKSPTAEQVAARIFSHPGDGVSPTIRRAAADAIEVRFVAKDDEDLSMFFFYLMASLGHAVYL